jgi:hypothetical protein
MATLNTMTSTTPIPAPRTERPSPLSAVPAVGQRCPVHVEELAGGDLTFERTSSPAHVLTASKIAPATATVGYVPLAS